MDTVPERIPPAPNPTEEDMIAVEARIDAVVIELVQVQAVRAELQAQLHALNAILHHHAAIQQFVAQRAERRLIVNLGFFGEKMVNQIATLVTTSLQCL